MFDECYKEDSNTIKTYLKKVSTITYIDKSFLNSDFLYMDDNEIAEQERFEAECKQYDVTNDMLIRWGIYESLTPKTIKWCDDYYNSLQEEHDFKDKDVISMTYKNLVLNYLFAATSSDMLDQQKAQINIEKIEKSLGVQQSQGDDDLKDKTLGTLIRDMEKEDVFYPKSEWKDFDGFDQKIKEVMVWNEVTIGKASKENTIEKYFEEENVK